MSRKRYPGVSKRYNFVKRVKPLEQTPHHTAYGQTPRSTKSARLVPIKNEKDKVIGYADPVYGTLFKKNYTRSYPTFANRKSSRHAKLRAAAEAQGIYASSRVQRAEDRELEDVEPE